MAWGVHARWNLVLILIQLLPSWVNLVLELQFLYLYHGDTDISIIEMSSTHFENILFKSVERQAVGAHFVPSVGEKTHSCVSSIDFSVLTEAKRNLAIIS